MSDRDTCDSDVESSEEGEGEALAALRCLAAAAAHDLKNTLGFLRLQLDGAESADRGFGALDVERAREGIADGMALADRFSALVHGLTTDFAPVPLRHLLTDQQKRIEREHGERLLVVTDYTDRSLVARCRPGRTLGVLRRMVDQAIAALSEGMLILRAEQHEEGARLVVGAVEMPVGGTDMLDEVDLWIERFRTQRPGIPTAAGVVADSTTGGVTDAEGDGETDSANRGTLVYWESLTLPHAAKP